MFLACTCIYKYINYVQAYTSIYLYILQYTSMIILIQGAGFEMVVPGRVDRSGQGVQGILHACFQAARARLLSIQWL